MSPARVNPLRPLRPPTDQPPSLTGYHGNMRMMTRILTVILLMTSAGMAEPLNSIRISDDGTHFVRGNSNERIVVWGVNYDHDTAGRLLDKYWIDEWPVVVEDFQEIKALGANCVRIPLQLGRFMSTPDTPNSAALNQLGRLVRLAENTGLYLDLTGLACYHKQHIPEWHDEMSQQHRWAVQAVFWAAVVRTCRHSPAIFCYDLMNEPILPGAEQATNAPKSRPALTHPGIVQRAINLPHRPAALEVRLSVPGAPPVASGTICARIRLV